MLVKRPLFVQFDCSVNRCLDNWKIFFRAELQFVVDPLALFADLRNKRRIEITLNRQLAYPNQLQNHRYAGNRLLQFDIGKITRINADLLRQCPARDIQSFPCGLYISAKVFKPRTIFSIKEPENKSL